MLKVPFKTYCPPSCGCGCKSIKDWKHDACSTQAYLNQEGDVSCANGCPNVSIQNVGFYCGKNITKKDFKSSVQLLMAFSQVMQSNEFNLTDKQKVEFLPSLCMKVGSKWNF